MATTVEQLDGIAQRILNPDNAIRRAAEQEYDAFHDSDATVFFTGALAVVRSPTASTKARGFYAEMLTQNLKTNCNMWDSVDPVTQVALRDSLSEAFISEADMIIRRRITFAIASLAMRLAKTSDLTTAWPGLMDHALSGCVHTEAPVRAGCFELLARIGESVTRSLAPVIGATAAAIVAGTADPDLTVSVRALQAGACIAVGTARLALTAGDAVDSSNDAQLVAAVENAFLSLVPASCRALVACLEADDEDRITEALDALKDIARANPSHYFAGSLEDVVPLLGQVCDAEFLNEERRSALMLLLALAGGANGKSMVRSSPSWVNTVLTTSFAWLVKVEVSQSWLLDPTFDDEIVNPFHHAAQYALSQLPVMLGAVTFTKLVMGKVLELLRSPEWQSQVAGLLGVLSIAEKAWKAGAKHILPMSLHEFLAPERHIRVRWTAMGVIGKIADQSRKFVNTNAKQILPAFVALMDESTCPVRVVCASCIYLINVLSSMDQAKLRGAQETLFTTLSGLLASESADIRMAALSAVSAVSIASQDDFAPFYQTVMTGLLQLLSRSIQLLEDGVPPETVTPLRQLVGKACETVGFVSQAGGREAFTPDAEVAVSLIARVQTYEARQEDGAQEMSARAVETIAQTLKEDFARFLPTVLEPMLLAAGVGDVYAQFDLDADDRILPGDAERAEHYSESNGYSLIVLRRPDGSGKRRIAVHTARLQEKILACNMLCNFATELKIAFGPFVSRAAEVLVPLCAFRYHPMVRSAALASMPALFNAAKAIVARDCGIPEEAHEGLTYLHLWPAEASARLKDTWEAVYTAILSHSEAETISNYPSVLLAASAALDHLPTRADPEQLLALGTLAVRMAQDSLEDRAEHLATVAGAAENDTDEETLEEAQSALELSDTNLEAASVLLASVARNAGPDFFPASVVMPFVSQLLSISPEQDPQVFCPGLSTMSSIMRFAMTGPSLTETAQQVLPTTLRYAGAPKHILRRAAADALRVIVNALPSADFAPFLAEALNQLVPALAIAEPDEDEREDCEYATDNVAAAVVVILDKFALCDTPVLTPEPTAQVIDALMSVLPRVSDEDVCGDVNAFFMRLVAAGRPEVMGADNANLPRVLNIMAEALDCEQEESIVIVHTADIKAMKAYWQSVKAALGPETAAQVWAQIDEDFRDALETADEQ